MKDFGRFQWLTPAALGLAGVTACGSSGDRGDPAAVQGDAGDGAPEGGSAAASGSAGNGRGGVGGGGSHSAGGVGGGGSTGTGTGTGGRSTGGGNGGASGGGSAGSSGGADPGAGGARTYPPGTPGCGLDAAAFCDTFDGPAGKITRAGELDPARWSAARMCNIGGPSGDGEAVAIGPARVPPCRAGLPAEIFPSSDALVCDGNDRVQSNHLLVVVAAQNYGQNSYRIRQPFDFADREGTIVFDGEGYNVGNHGWISLEVTEDPAPAPSFTLQQNFENGVIPRNGLEVQLNHNCGGDHVGVASLFVYDDYVQDEAFSFLDDAQACAVAAEGRLNRFTVKLSKDHVEVLAADASEDGVAFGAPVTLLSRDVALPFTRGYVHLTAHNHATLKYSDGAMDAWHARFDNVGFDGPAITSAFREYEALDSLTHPNGNPRKVDVGWRLDSAENGPAQEIEIHGVDLAGVTGARIALGSWSLHFAGETYPDDFAIQYRLNGHAWREQRLTPAEIAMAAALPNAGTRASMLDVDVADLVTGANTLELTTTGAPLSYPPVALNIDLILKTE